MAPKQKIEIFCLEYFGRGSGSCRGAHLEVFKGYSQLSSGVLPAVLGRPWVLGFKSGFTHVELVPGL